MGVSLQNKILSALFCSQDPHSIAASDEDGVMSALTVWSGYPGGTPEIDLEMQGWSERRDTGLRFYSVCSLSPVLIPPSHAPHLA